MTGRLCHGPEELPILLSTPEFGGREWQYVRDCLETGWVSSAGPYVQRFEQMVSEYVGVDHAVATVNGTAALHVALQVAGVKAGDEVLVSSLTFIAPANAIRYVGAYPVFIDAEPDYWQMDPAAVAHFLQRQCHRENGRLINRETGRRIAAILPVHILGHPVHFEPIAALAREHEIPVIEDASQSLGAVYQGQKVGALGDVACFSFNGNKIITAGGGGIIATDNENWARHARYLTTQAKDDPVEYIHGEVGYNYRLTNLQAALGCAQLEMLDEFVEAKRRIAKMYGEKLAKTPGLTPMAEAPWARSTFWLYTLLVREEVYGVDSRTLLGQLAKQGIQARPLWQPIHQSPAHADGFAHHAPTAERIHRNALSLPSSTGITDGEIGRVCAAISSRR